MNHNPPRPIERYTPEETKFISALSRLDDDMLIDIEEHAHFLLNISVYANQVATEGDNCIKDALDLFFESKKPDVDSLLDSVRQNAKCMAFLKKHPRALLCLENYETFFLGGFNKKDLLHLRRIALQSNLNVREVTEKESKTILLMIDAEINQLVIVARDGVNRARSTLIRFTGVALFLLLGYKLGSHLFG